MGRKDLFDEIIECISLEGERAPLLSLDSGVRTSLFAPLQRGTAPKQVVPPPKPAAQPRPAAPQGLSSPGPSVQRREPGAAPAGPASKVSQVKEEPKAYRPAGTLPAGDLGLLQKAVSACEKCKLHSGRTNTVFGSGPSTAKLMFIGEGPGEDEDRQGEPFVGRAGQLLTRIIQSINLTREEVYIANIIKCRPPGNRNPEPDEIKACEPFLIKQLEAIRPMIICALGTFAAQTLLETDEKISRLRGRFFSYRNARLIATFHPAFLLRNPERKRDVWEDMKMIREEYGR